MAFPLRGCLVLFQERGLFLASECTLADQSSPVSHSFVISSRWQVSSFLVVSSFFACVLYLPSASLPCMCADRDSAYSSRSVHSVCLDLFFRARDFLFSPVPQKGHLSLPGLPSLSLLSSRGCALCGIALLLNVERASAGKAGVI